MKFSTWTLHMSVFALLVRTATAHQCPLHDVKPGTVSPVLDSLQCYNDYMSSVQCTWEEDPQIHPYAARNASELYYRDKIAETHCVPHRAGELLPNGKVSHSCQYNTTRFTKYTSHTLYFKVSCASRAHLTVAQQGKVLAPVNLTKTMTEGVHILSWGSPYPESSNITQTLKYQLQYCRNKDDWIVVDNITGLQHKIQLSPGFHYQARVRARGPVGLWSDWSPLVSWRTHNDGAFNLQCVIESESTVVCTWQMKTANSHFISYHLCCRNNDRNEACSCCTNPLIKSSNAELTEFSCSVETSDLYLLTVELRPAYNSKKFRTSRHIQLPQPDPVQVTETAQGYNLSWSQPNVHEFIKFSFEIQILTKEDSEHFKTIQDGTSYEILSSLLHPSTDYKVQIRLLFKDDDNYKAKDSEWSQPAMFTTGPGSWSISTIIYILVSVLVSVLFIILYNTLPACHRKIEIWQGSIPSPIHSRVLEGIIKKSSTGWPYLQSEKEKTSMCVLQTTDHVSVCKSSISGEPLLLHSDDMSFDASTVKMDWSDGLNSTPYIKEGICLDNSGMSFSGPYILCCEDSSGHDEIFKMPSDGDHSCLSEKSEKSAPINGGYVLTPPTTTPETLDPTHCDGSTNQCKTPGKSDFPSDEPPAYTPSLDQNGMAFPHPSGYFMMPCAVQSQSEQKGYVTLAQSGT